MAPSRSRQSPADYVLISGPVQVPGPGGTMAQGSGRKTRSAGTFGSVDQRASGRYRARYIGPDGQRHQAPTLFVTKAEARAWLALRQSEIIRRAWQPPEATPKAAVTFTAYAQEWLACRELK